MKFATIYCLVVWLLLLLLLLLMYKLRSLVLQKDSEFCVGQEAGVNNRRQF